MIACKAVLSTSSRAERIAIVIEDSRRHRTGLAAIVPLVDGGVVSLSDGPQGAPLWGDVG
jgi:hypothetical protein